MKPTIAVIGGGAAGLFASIAAATHGANVIALERNKKVGICQGRNKIGSSAL